MRFPVVAVVLWVALAGCTLGRGQACPPQYVIAEVMDAQGRTVPNLAAANFRASYRGSEISITSASLREDPGARTILLLDTSVTMGGFGAEGFNKWRIARSAASQFIGVAPPQASVSLFTFSSKLEQSFRSSSGRQPIADWLDSRKTSQSSFLKGTKAFYKTLPEVLKELEPAQPGDAIYLITDGREFTDGATLLRAADELQSSGVRLFAFLLDDVTFTSARPQLGGGQVSDLVQGSGGLGIVWYPSGRSGTGRSWSDKSFEYDEATTPQRIRASDYRIEGAITHFYVLSLAPHAGPPGPDNWKLEVVDAQGNKRNDVFVAYPGKFQGCNGGTGSH
ncbi:MAG: VWA domain-containing protein [Candidatus Sulfotelmatobacter sp.]